MSHARNEGKREARTGCRGTCSAEPFAVLAISYRAPLQPTVNTLTGVFLAEAFAMEMWQAWRNFIV